MQLQNYHKNTQEALKNFGVDLIITDVRIGAFHGIKKLTKNHFALTSRKAFPKDGEVRLRDHALSVNDLRRR